MVTWACLPLNTLDGRLQAALGLPPAAFLSWWKALQAGSVLCLICGERCGPDGRHEAVMIAVSTRPLNGDKNAVATMCFACGCNHADEVAAATRMMQAIEVGNATGGRAWGPTHHTPGRVQ